MLFRSDLKNQITNRKITTDGKQRFMLESKSDYKQRAGQSPDDFDAFMLGNYGRHINKLTGAQPWTKDINKNTAAFTLAAAMRNGVKKW